jgi:hypothetical protein
VSAVASQFTRKPTANIERRVSRMRASGLQRTWSSDSCPRLTLDDQHRTFDSMLESHRNCTVLALLQAQVTPDGHFKFPRLWPVKFLQAGPAEPYWGTPLALRLSG